MSLPPEDEAPQEESFLATIVGRDGDDASSDAANDLPADEAKAKHRRRNRILLATVSAFLAIVIVTGAVFVALVLNQVGKVFKGNPLNAIGSVLGITGSALKTDAYGNTNLVIFGTTEDDPGHNASNSLTDSIMVVSINQKRKDAVTFSVPRDLWVTYPTAGCAAGSQGKINATYACGLNNDAGGLSGNEDAGQAALASVVSKVLGVQIQYTAHVNMSVVRDAVNAVGGITITVASSDPRGISEPAMAHRCSNSDCVVKYPNGKVHLNGGQAMWLSQARNDGAGYGLPRGDFDRQLYQRKMAVAIEQKAKSSSFLANPINVLDLLDAMGANVRSNIPSDVIGSFISTARNLSVKKIYSVDFDKAGLYTTGMYHSASIVRPVAGMFDYSRLREFTHTLLLGTLPVHAVN